MGKSKHTPNATKKDNPFKLMGGARKLRLKKKCKAKSQSLDIELLNKTFSAARASCSSTVTNPQRPQDKTKATPTTQSQPPPSTTVEESINNTIDIFAHL
ncbi:hypothetical protein EMCRGX_G031624 [Ephydatia muelleri]